MKEKKGDGGREVGGDVEKEKWRQRPGEIRGGEVGTKERKGRSGGKGEVQREKLK